MSTFDTALEKRFNEAALITAIEVTSNDTLLIRDLETGEIMRIPVSVLYSTLGSASLTLGETSATAYRGDHGKTAYDHSQTIGNPHSTTKSDINLSNVDNTSDVNKPVSTAQQTAINLKQNSNSNLTELSSSRIVRKVLSKNLIANNTLTSVFRITTTDESGGTDAGAYVCNMFALVGHNATSYASGAIASKGIKSLFVRSMTSLGVGVNSSFLVTDETPSIATNASLRDITSVTFSIVEISEYINEIKVQIVLAGSSIATGDVLIDIELIYSGFLTAPTISIV